LAADLRQPALTACDTASARAAVACSVDDIAHPVAAQAFETWLPVV